MEENENTLGGQLDELRSRFGGFDLLKPQIEGYMKFGLTIDVACVMAEVDYWNRIYERS